MKAVLFAILSLFAMGATAGTATLHCSNVGNSIEIEINDGSEFVRLRVGERQYRIFAMDELMRTEKQLYTLSKGKNCGSDKVVKEITLSLTSRLKLPSTWTVNAQTDGSLKDFFICEEGTATIPDFTTTPPTCF